MTAWKILLTDGLEEGGQSILRSNAILDNRENCSPEELISIIDGYNALIVRGRTRVTRQVFEKGSRLKVIGRSGVGVDNIDLTAANDHDVVVVNAPISTSLAVAELALGLLFALARAIPQANQGMKNGQWVKKQLTGSELSGKTLGVVGMGNIGRLLAQRAAGLGMQVLGYDPLLDSDEIFRRGAQPRSLDELYAHSDYISFHVPLTPQTHGMVDSTAFQKMKPEVRLVSTARGGLLDEAALLLALNSGQVAGAALDVFSQEPPGLTSLVAHPNVIATPHIGAQTVEAQNRAAVDIANEVLAALRGDPLRWRVA